MKDKTKVTVSTVRAAEICGVSTTTIHNHIDSGALPVAHYKFGNRARILIDDLKIWALNNHLEFNYP